MTKDELRAKYARIPADFSQLRMLKDQLVESGLLDIAKIDATKAGKFVGIKSDGKIGLLPED